MKQCLITSYTLRVYLEVTATKSNNITFFTYVESKRTYRYLGDQSIRQSKYNIYEYNHILRFYW